MSPGFDDDAQAQLGMEFGDQKFGSLGKDQLKCFLDQDEEECLQANPFVEDDQCEEPSNSSVFSGMSDKSIMLRNSNLLSYDTSQVNLEQLKIETQGWPLLITVIGSLRPQHSEPVVRTAFQALQLVLTDFLPLSLHNCLQLAVHIAAKFGSQTQDLNISLTAVGLL